MIQLEEKFCDFKKKFFPNNLGNAVSLSLLIMFHSVDFFSKELLRYRGR